jgi:hypothetical protein
VAPIRDRRQRAVTPRSNGPSLRTVRRHSAGAGATVLSVWIRARTRVTLTHDWRATPEGRLEGNMCRFGVPFLGEGKLAAALSQPARAVQTS